MLVWLLSKMIGSSISVIPAMRSALHSWRHSGAAAAQSDASAAALFLHRPVVPHWQTIYRCVQIRADTSRYEQIRADTSRYEQAQTSMTPLEKPRPPEKRIDADGYMADSAEKAVANSIVRALC